MEDFGFMVDKSGGNDPVGMKARCADAGGIPDLMAVLWVAYRSYIRKEFESRRKRGERMAFPNADAAAKAAPAENFVKFASSYLNKNRGVQTFVADDNVGIMLRNQVRCILSPGVRHEPGSMQNSGAIVPVTHGHSQPELGGMEPGGAIEIH